MIQFQAPVDILGLRRQQMVEDQARINMQRQYQQDMFSALSDVAGAYKDYNDSKNQAAAMDKGVGMMSDLGVIDPGIRDSFMNLDRSHKPLVYELLSQSMFKPYAAGQAAAQQAQAWDQYKNSGGGMPGGARNQYGYFYQGP